MNEISFLNLRLHALSMEETLVRIGEIIKKRDPVQHVVLNAAKVVHAQKDADLRNQINACGLINSDGQAVVWGARMLGHPLSERVAGIDLMDRIIAEAEHKKWRLYFLGAKEEIVREVVAKTRKKYPGVIISGYRNGYFDAQEEKKVVDEIKKSKSDVLFVGISSPKKEAFLNRNLQHMEVPFCMGVGGSFDVIAGKTKRAPAIMQKTGMEWLYRIYQEPRRMWKRYATTNPVFVWLVLKEWFKLRVKSNIKSELT